MCLFLLSMNKYYLKVNKEEKLYIYKWMKNITEFKKNELEP